MYPPSQNILKCLFCHNDFMWCYMRSCYFSVVMCFNVCATNVIWPFAFLTTAQNHWKWSEWSEHRTFCTLLSVFSIKFLLILKHYVLNSGIEVVMHCLCYGHEWCLILQYAACWEAIRHVILPQWTIGTLAISKDLNKIETFENTSNLCFLFSPPKTMAFFSLEL